MGRKQVTLMINGTVRDLIGEYNYFIKEIFPDLKRYCDGHDIDLKYIDVSYSLPGDVVDKDKRIREYFKCIDIDRTFFICFRAQRCGWIPSSNDADIVTLNMFPELVKYVGPASLTDLLVMHALKPFYTCDGTSKTELKPVKHALFYYRHPDYVENLSPMQKFFYTNLEEGDDEEVHDMCLAKAKDLIYDIKEEFDSSDEECDITIRDYHGRWNGDLMVNDVVRDYIESYSELCGRPSDELFKIYTEVDHKHVQGCFDDFTFEDLPLKEIVMEDIISALKADFPENFQ